MTRATLEYIAAGGNRHPSSADWAPSLLAFGAGNNIALWNPEDERHAGVYSLLTGHTDAVNAIKVLDHGSRRTLISGGADSTIRIWSSAEESPSGFQETDRLIDHSASVNAIATLPGSDLFASGAADGLVKIWYLADATAQLLRTISLKPRYFPLALALTSLSNGAIVLAVAGTSNIIQLYVRPTSGQDFELQATLTGHEGWVRSLDFTREHEDPGSDVLLASASQDKYIRLWRFHRGHSKDSRGSSVANDVVAAAEKKSLSNKAHEVGSSGFKYTVTFEALLIGHEDWIYTVRWAPTSDNDAIPALLSASADNSLSIWHADSGSGLWVCSTRLGEISSQKGSTTATGSTGGFWIGLWQPQSKSVASLGRTGSWRKWDYDATSDIWLQRLGVSGHVEEVKSLAWSPSGNYLLTTSSDQTTRLISEWKRNDRSSWHEFSRPQIHGYDLNCLDAVTENQFISGADEKLLRVFNKPKATDNLLWKLGGVQSALAEDLPDAANIPVLGLSNKAIAAVVDDDEQPNGLTNGHAHDQDAVDPASIVHKSTLELDQPPVEDHLARHTLWPEHEKLYGHGYEISAVATSNDGSLVATACKASSIDHAVIRLYDTKAWREVKPALTAHSLTVTSLAFSKDDKYLLSVGRDRQWAVFERQTEAITSYVLFTSNPKGHSRMILDCSWAPHSAGHVFATAGRDKTVKIWRLRNGTVDLANTIVTSSAVTVVAFDLQTHADSLWLAYGNDAGAVGLVRLDLQDCTSRDEQCELDASIVPVKSVTSLRWRPAAQGMMDDGSTSARGGRQLAVASEDHALRLYNIS